MDVLDRFKYHKPGDFSTLLHQSFRNEFLKIAQQVNALPDSREKSLALTALQESSMWVHAAIAMDDPVAE